MKQYIHDMKKETSLKVETEVVLSSIEPVHEILIRHSFRHLKAIRISGLKKIFLF